VADTTDERFHLLRWSWNVTRGWQIAGDRGAVDIPVSALGSLLGLIRIDHEHVKTVDTSRPLLAVPFPDDPSVLLVIDGWHRIARAVTDGLESLPVVPLSADEAREILA
jgi:hypothetical protein